MNYFAKAKIIRWLYPRTLYTIENFVVIAL